MPFLVAEVSPVGLVCTDFLLAFVTGSTIAVFRGDIFEDWAPLGVGDFVFSEVEGFVFSEVEDFVCSAEEGGVFSALCTERAEKRA